MPDNDVFILGAGFSKSINSHMPTMNELTEAVSRKLESSGISLPPPLKDPQNKSGKEIPRNIELWMTFLSENQPWIEAPFNESNRAITGFIRRYIRDVIEECTWESMRPTNVLTDDPSTMPAWLSNLVSQWHERATSVISLNYDTLVERVAESELHPTVRPHYPTYLSRNDLINPPFLHSRGRRTFSLLKLHGSTNWHYSGRQDFYGEPIYYSDVSPWGPNIFESERESVQFSRHREPLIIPPLMEKSTFFTNEAIRRLWRDASRALEAATRVFVIGYSLPQSDLGMQFFLKQSLPASRTHWYIVNLDKSIASRYQKLLMPDQAVNYRYVTSKEPVVSFAADYCNDRIPVGNAAG